MANISVLWSRNFTKPELKDILKVGGQVTGEKIKFLQAMKKFILGHFGNGQIGLYR